MDEREECCICGRDKRFPVYMPCLVHSVCHPCCNEMVMRSTSWGYDGVGVVPSTPALRCPLCREQSDDVVDLDLHGVNLASDPEIDRLRLSRQCPYCERSKASMLHVQRCDKRPTQCCCGETVSASTRVHHYNSKAMVCQLPGCGCGQKMQSCVTRAQHEYKTAQLLVEQAKMSVDALHQSITMYTTKVDCGILEQLAQIRRLARSLGNTLVLRELAIPELVRHLT